MGAMTTFAAAAGLTAAGLRDIGPDYAITLRAWRENWRARWRDIAALGYSEAFMRKWCARGACPAWCAEHSAGLQRFCALWARAAPFRCLTCGRDGLRLWLQGILLCILRSCIR